MMIGHSQGGMQAVKVVHALASTRKLRVRNPITRKTEKRTDIIDPLTGEKRPAHEVQFSYVSVVSAGGFTRLLPNQWSMTFSLRRIPDSTVDFTGFSKGSDPLGGDFFGRRLYDDTLETLETLRLRGYRLGCVTNRAFGGPAFVDEVQQLGLAPYFESLAVSCEVGYMKPHKFLFEHALDELGVTGAQTLHVGDSLVADVQGAQALGMTAVWRIPRKRFDEPSGIIPDYTINQLRELLALPLLAGE